MATLTTLELLSPPADVAREAQAQIAMALQQGASNQSGPMAAAFTTNFAAQSAAIIADSAVRSALSSIPASASSGTGGTLSDGLADPQVTKRAYEDIRALADSIRSARASFQLVESVVNDIDRMMFFPTVGAVAANVTSVGAVAAGVATSVGAVAASVGAVSASVGAAAAAAGVVGAFPTNALSPKWSEIRQRFEGALRASIQVAPMAISSMNDVSDLLGSAAGKSHGDLKARLQAFMRDVKVKEAQALDVKNQFQNVVDRLRTFWADVEAAFATPFMRAIQPLVVQILVSNIAQLTRQLESLQQMLGALNSAALSEVATGGIGAAMTIYQLCPTAFFLIMFGAFSGGVGNLLNSTVQQINSVKAQIESARRQLTREQQQQVILQDPKSYLNEVALKLDTVVNIWQTINLDMHALYTDLSTNVSDDAPVTVFFLSKMKVSKEIYGKLAWLLGIYVEQMRSL